MRSKRFAVLAALIAGGALAAGLAASVGSAAHSKAQAGYKVFLIPKFVGIPVFTQNSLGAKAAAKELGDTVVYNGPTEASATAQVPFIDAAVRQGANAIIISADDPNAVAPALKRAMAKGVKVISYDADVAPSARTVYVSPPAAHDMGFFEGEWLGSQIGYKGQIAILEEEREPNLRLLPAGVEQARSLVADDAVRRIRRQIGIRNEPRSLAAVHVRPWEAEGGGPSLHPPTRSRSGTGRRWPS